MLTKQEIEHIADLARLELSDEELKKYGSQLSDVLLYIDQLQNVDTENVGITAQVASLKNIFREDKIENWNKEEIKSSLNQAPDLEDNQIKVGRVLA
ncbi:MAG: Asp-tRNA(Asn)/Glu-tRNA(Gln) amidotransferase subunit GatC [bacterium]